MPPGAPGRRRVGAGSGVPLRFHRSQSPQPSLQAHLWRPHPIQRQPDPLEPKEHPMIELSPMPSASCIPQARQPHRPQCRPGRAQPAPPLGFFLGVGGCSCSCCCFWAGTRLVREDTRSMSATGALLYHPPRHQDRQRQRWRELRCQRGACPPSGVRGGFCHPVAQPKAMIATLPITSIQFPAAQIHGWSLLPWSLPLGSLPPVPPAATRWLAASSDVIFNILAGSGTPTC